MHSTLIRMECINCAKSGHTFRDCKEPVMSYGICAVKFVDSVPYYLMICRRDSLAYVEFLRGKYKMDSKEYIQSLVDGMTVDERVRLAASSFEKLWDNLWNGQNTRQYRHEFEAAKRVFENLKNTGDMGGRLLVHYLEGATVRWDEPEWGLPKGRRALHESEQACAVREFVEETGLNTKSLHLLDAAIHEVEDYIGTNGIHYRQIYYIGGCAAGTTAEHQPHNRVMAREVRAIGWFPYEVAILKIRDNNPHKRELIERLHLRITSTEMRSTLNAAIEWTRI